ncbi:MAG: hypothetical protein IGS48_02470 [Oscillatoriales cyanobacterium C42_A2020_001]|nr:hypothetical protein [Leptolyngbyaceae cyanobacterium C42_A2020_001]
MTPEELTTVVTAHQSAISRHDLEMAEIRSILSHVAQQQSLNQESIATLTASIQELRNLVADYIQGRSQS